MIVSTPSGTDCPRPGVVPFDTNSSHFVLSTNSCRAFYIGRMEKSAGHSRPCPHGGRRPRRWPASRAAELRFPPPLVR